MIKKVWESKRKHNPTRLEEWTDDAGRTRLTLISGLRCFDVKIEDRADIIELYDMHKVEYEERG